MKQLIEMFFFDVKMTFKTFMGSYLILVPILILLVLRGFLPSVENASTVIAVVNEGPNAVPSEMIDTLAAKTEVQLFPTIEAMENKLRGTGTVEGLYWDPSESQYVSLLERSLESNKSFSNASRIIRQSFFHENYPEAESIVRFVTEVPPELSERTEISPVATMGGAIFFVFMVVINGFVIGLGLVNDKEEGTDRALRASPVTTLDYFIGKSLFPLIAITVYVIVALVLLGLLEVNILQVYVVVIGAFPLTLFFGVLLGSLAGNETEAIGVGKMLSMLMMLSILGGTLLPSGWQWVVYWTPFYWLYDILESVLTESAAWGELLWKTALTVGITGIYFVLLRKRIVRGLS